MLLSKHQGKAGTFFIMSAITLVSIATSICLCLACVWYSKANTLFDSLSHPLIYPFISFLVLFTFVVFSSSTSCYEFVCLSNICACSERSLGRRPLVYVSHVTLSPPAKTHTLKIHTSAKSVSQEFCMKFVETGYTFVWLVSISMLFKNIFCPFMR